MTLKELHLFNRTLDDINVSLKDLQELAAADFSNVFDVFKANDFFDEVNRKHNEDKLNRNYYDLHCYDVFCQQAEHIIQIHKLLQYETVNNNIQLSGSPKYSLVRLNQLQFDVAWGKWDVSIKRIKQFLISNVMSVILKERLHQALDINLLMMGTGKNIQMRFGLLSELCPSWIALDLTPKLPLVNKLYTTLTERLVLNAYLTDMLIHPEAILNNLPDIEKENSPIELF